MRFFKYHALGEDVVILLRGELLKRSSPEDIARIARHIGGIGAHTVVVRGREGRNDPFLVQTKNELGKPRGWGASVLQCYARYLWDEGQAPNGEFQVNANHRETKVEVLREGQSVAVLTPAASFLSHDVPVTGPPREIVNEKLKIEDMRLEFSAINLEAPHCLVHHEEWAPEEIHRYGPLIETESRFPSGANVHFYHCKSNGVIQIASWLRELGHTTCSDLGAAACLLAANRRKLTGERATIQTDEGVIHASIQDERQVRLEASVRKIADGIVCPELFAS